VTARVAGRPWRRSAALLALLFAVGVTSSEATQRSATPADEGAPQTVTDRVVAVTFDDLPLGGPQFDVERMAVMTNRLVGAIVEQAVPVVGFVNESKLDVEGEREARLDLLRTWAGAGLELGNHTYSHPSPHRVPLQQYFDDVVRGEPRTRVLMAEQGGELRYFRHPFLFRGQTPADKEAIDAFLAQRGYTIAPVTMDNADYIYSAVYTDAKTRGDLALMERVADAYIEFSAQIYDFYEDAAEALFDRPIAHVYLLHANELNAATFDRFAALTRARGYRFVSLGEALRDPAYESADRYAGPAGTSWLFRWDATQAQESGARKVNWRSEPSVQAWVQEAFDNR
jgi:peptidoglycan/xylan/chitin deacetylase (PgdA/CDA1 family)